MLDNLNCGPHGYASHEASFAMENEYQSGGSMQMMPPNYHSNQQHMSYSSGPHGPKYGGHGWHHGGGGGGSWSGHNGTGYYGHGSAPGGMHGPGHRMSSNNMMSSEYHAGPGRMRMQNYGMHAENYDDYATGAHGGRQKVEWKAL
ncbi:hypothetical protein OWV82_019140 [Melia azedarach]|uniref:Uncharacterized protein n=1 Tax=Melia azedarach TaxID=155640 RepID=A0ACC1XDY4_MELAZ|nr:hypothetical protein OWV82_019140 [Melia azedarach]